MRATGAKNLLASFALATGLSLSTVATSFAQEAAPTETAPQQPIEVTQPQAETGDSKGPALKDIRIDIPENLNYDQIMELVGQELGLDAERTEQMNQIIAANMMRLARMYIDPIVMEDLDKDIAEGMLKRIQDRPEHLEKAQESLAKAESALREAQQTYDALRNDENSSNDDLIDARDEVYRRTKTIEQAHNILDYVRDEQNISLGRLIDAGLDYALAKKDPHSDFSSPEARPGKRQSGAGFVGIGATIRTDGRSKYYIENNIVINSTLHPEDGSPALKAGLLKGDLISAIDGKSVAGLTLEDAIKLLKGAPDTSVRVSIIRNGEALEQPIEIKRTPFFAKNVTSRIIDGNIAYIHINSFMNERGANLDPMVQEDTEAAIKKIQETLGGADNVAGYMISVRDDGGGSLTEVVDLLNRFIDGEKTDRTQSPEEIEASLRRNTLVTTKGRFGLDDRYLATPGDITGGKPVIVLANGGSASASEIFSGTIQDMRGDVVGITTFGKGSVQIVSPGPYDYGTNHFTIAKYYYGPGNSNSPFGKSIQGVGVIPDNETPFVEKYDRSEAGLDNAFITPEDANQINKTEYTCDIADESQLEILMQDNPSFIDPRSGDYDYQAACGVYHIRHVLAKPAASPKFGSENGVVLSPYVAPMEPQ